MTKMGEELGTRMRRKVSDGALALACSRKFREFRREGERVKLYTDKKRGWGESKGTRYRAAEIRLNKENL